jgi:hypothetical protein
MTQVKKETSVDKYSFRCCNRTCQKFKTHRSIRANSFLEDFNIPLKKFLHFLYLYTSEVEVSKITKLVEISISQTYKLVSKLRLKINSHFEAFPIVLGGPGIVVQIDESKFNFNVKANRGHAPVEKVWVFAMVDTSYRPAREMMKIVERRDKRTFLRLF